MMITQSAVAKREQEWFFDVPPTQIKKDRLTLLTIGKVQVEGYWQGGLGEYFVGWAPLVNPKKVYNALRQEG